MDERIRRAGSTPRRTVSRARAALAAPAFLVVLVAAYGVSRGLADAFAPLDRWIDAHVLQPAEAGLHGADTHHQDGP